MCISGGEFTEDLLPLIENDDYYGELAISISACGSGENTVSNFLKKIKNSNNGTKLPKYIFSILGETVNWDDALVGWILLYHKISTIGISNRQKVIDAIKKIYECLKVQFAYKRFDEPKNKYYNYPSKEDG